MRLSAIWSRYLKTGYLWPSVLQSERKLLLVFKCFAKITSYFYEYHQSGSHIQLRHPINKELRVTIPFHRKELTPKTLKSIIKQSDLTVDKFIEIL